MSFILLKDKIYNLKPFSRKLILLVIDASLFPFSAFLAFWIKYSKNLDIHLINSSLLVLFSSLIGITIFLLSGQYKTVTRYASSSVFYGIFFRNIVSVTILIFLTIVFNIQRQSFSFWFLFVFFSTFGTTFYRYLIRDLIIKSRASKKQSIIIIYGAGAAGAQLASTLRMNGKHTVAYFVDDDPQLWNRTINNIEVLTPFSLEELKVQIDEVFLAIPSVSKSRRAKIIEFIQDKGIKVRQVPSINDLTSGKSRIDSVRPIDIEDLLGRDPVIPDSKLLAAGISGSTILVTGAGGSIGSELCRQIISFSPTKLILFEKSELSLYQINQELSFTKFKNAEIIPLLGCATNFKLIDTIISKHKVEIIFHAAAYKHVPLLEENPLQGLYNNVFSTRTICQAAEKSQFTKKVILISSDKAVRPTNIMGASKRLSELVVQAYADRNLKSKKYETCFSMVRFGNVLGSSGSVVPLFKKQIRNGGPITITDPNMTRYFMTIIEASQLVLQASSLSVGGELFLLDMGEPVKIIDLAKKMLSLHSLKVKNKSNYDGDIEIISTGLRPGEKLYEELLIDSESQSTIHPLIFKANEKFIESTILFPKLKIFEKQLLDNKKDALNLLKDLVKEWQSK